MTTISIGLLLVIAYFGFRGFQRGLVEEVGRLAGLILAVILADQLSPAVAAQLGFESAPARTAVAVIIIFVSTLAAMALVTKVLRTLVELVLLGWLDRIGGVLFGVLKAVLIIGVLIFMAEGLNMTRALTERLQAESFIYRQIVAVTDGMFKILSLDALLEGFQEKIEQVDPKELVRPLLDAT